ncbi:MAG: iron ABC transporter permease [Phycisphaeraceae bacterium]|nr:iron ABC transporter permease [Phycisphaeraceae bacterium]
MRRAAIWHYGFLTAMLLVLGALLLYPIFLTTRGAFFDDVAGHKGFTLVNLRLVFEDPSLVGGLFNSLRIAATTTLLAMTIALPLAVLSVRCRFPLKGVFNALVLVPLILPPFVGAIGFKMMLGRHGAINTLLGTDFDLLGDAQFWGVVAVQALSLYPIVYLNATAALANLDPALDEAAENLGAGFLRRFFTITLPLIRPGLFAGGTIVFIWSFTELGTPLVFDYKSVTPVQIFLGLKEVESSPQPYALTLVMLVVAVGVYLLGRVLFGGRAYAMHAKASRAASEHALPGWRGALAAAAFAGVIGLALLPHLGVVLTALAEKGTWYRSVLPAEWTLHNFREALTHPDAFGSIVNSLKLSLAAVALNLSIGLAVGYLLVRTTIKGRWLLDALCMLPLAVPGLVLAFGYVAMSLQWPFKGGPLEGLASVIGANPNPFPLLVAAYAVRRLPYIVRATVAGLEQTSGQMEEAALNLGASRLTAVRRIIVPLIAANLIAGALLAFSFSMLEVSDSLILAQSPSDFPITKAIFSFTNRLADGVSIASAMGVWGMALLTATLVGASVLLGKKLGAIFRV